MKNTINTIIEEIKKEKFELPADMMAAIQKAINYYTPFVTKDSIDLVGLWCNKITKELKGDFDGDIPWNQKYNKSTKKIKLYEKATVLPENKEKIICVIFDDIDELEEYLN